MIDLRWEGDDEQQYLFAGSNETELAVLRKRTKLWSVVIWLPGIDRGREYNTLAAHQKNIGGKVQHWFARALGDPKPLIVAAGEDVYERHHMEGLLDERN